MPFHFFYAMVQKKKVKMAKKLKSRVLPLKLNFLPTRSTKHPLQDRFYFIVEVKFYNCGGSPPAKSQNPSPRCTQRLTSWAFQGV